jgi:PAS domain-containing protein
LLEFLEETADAAFCVNQQGEICSWNAAAEKLFGYSSSEAIGQSCYGFCNAAAASAPSFARVSFTPDRPQESTAESLTLI